MQITMRGSDLLPALSQQHQGELKRHLEVCRAQLPNSQAGPNSSKPAAPGNGSSRPVGAHAYPQQPRLLTVPIIPSLVLQPISLGSSQFLQHQRLYFLCSNPLCQGRARCYKKECKITTSSTCFWNSLHFRWRACSPSAIFPNQPE